MESIQKIARLTIWSLLVLPFSPLAHAEAEFVSHSPMRPLPVASSRPLVAESVLFIDGKQGDDQDDGRKERPWKSLSFAMKQLKPGDTLCIRGGTYYEHVTVSVKGTEAKPIIIRSYPGEMVVIDGGLREFFESPDSSWEPFADGAENEFRSVKTYPNLGGNAGGTNVLGLFGDSMIPLHGYRYESDLRTSNEYFSKLDTSKTEAGNGIYCGPGLFYDVKSGHIHVRLAHTHQNALGSDNYQGAVDPRKIPLVVAGLNSGPALLVDGAEYVKFQDIVVRGSRTATVSVSNSANIDFDGVTSYGGSTAFGVSGSEGLRLWNCACRGIAAPWTYRGSLKYRAIEAKIFSASKWTPTSSNNRDFELAYSEFTDCVDGVFIGNVQNVRFHHNLLENVSDDGMFLTSTTAYDGTTPGGNVHIYQNLLSRCLTTFAFGVGHGRQKMTSRGRQTGSGLFIYRNIFDFRRPVMYSQPAEDVSQMSSFGRIGGDHGSPLWEPITFYQNTVLQVDAPFRSIYLGGLGGHLGGGSMRKLFNNIVVHTQGRPGHVLPEMVTPQSMLVAATKTKVPKKKSGDLLDDLLDDTRKSKGKSQISKDTNSDEIAKLKDELAKKAIPKPPIPVDFQTDANLHWSYSDSVDAESLLSKFHDSTEYAESKKLYSQGWATNDIVVDPQFMAFHSDWQEEIDLRLSQSSPVRNAGVLIPEDWKDPLRGTTRSKPDLGAIPSGVQPWRVGQQGRLSVFGQPVGKSIASIEVPGSFLLRENQITRKKIANTKPIMILEGYPAFDAPLIRFALSRENVPFESLTRTWLDPSEYSQYPVVVIVGNLPRAKIEPNTYSIEDLKIVQQYMENGGKLVLMRGNSALFGTPDGRAFLSRTIGSHQRDRDEFTIMNFSHAWLRHLGSKQIPAWVNARHVQPIRVTKGETIIGSKKGFATLFRKIVGKGELIYFGWDVSTSLPSGRAPSTVEQEEAYEEQLQILMVMFKDLCSAR